MKNYRNFKSKYAIRQKFEINEIAKAVCDNYASCASGNTDKCDWASDPRPNQVQKKNCF